MGFEDFWASYPRRQAKKDALRAWMKLNPSPALLDKMLDAIELQAKSKQWRQGYVPLAGSWIRGERWEDELTAEDFYQARL